jgi:MarR family transcriptional regulator for hemolysin
MKRDYSMLDKIKPRKDYEYNYELDVEDIEYLICHIAMLWRRVLNAKTKSLGIYGTERRVLICIARNPGLNQIQIANLLELEPQNLLRSLDKLEQLNWIKKRADTNDRRIKCLFITEESKKIVSQLKSIKKKIKPQILSGLNEEKTQQLLQYLTLIRENLFKELS